MKASLNIGPIRARLLRAALGLDGPLEPSAEQWGTWSSVAVTERMIPQLYEAMVDAAIGSAHLELATEMQLDVAAISVRIEHALLDVAQTLTCAGVPFAVLKGAATAHLDYRDSSERQFGDVDVLVDPNDMSRACEILRSVGWRQSYPLPPHHEVFTHAITFRRRGVVELDLHQRIAHRALGLRVPPTSLLSRRVPYEIAGSQLWALDDPDRLIHACIHAVTSRGAFRRLSSIADVLLLSRSLAHRADGVLARADGWGVRPLIVRAICDAWAEASLPLPPSWSSSISRATGGGDWLIRWAYLGDHRRIAAEELAHLLEMSSWRDRVLYTYGHLRMDAGKAGFGTRFRYLQSRMRRPD